MKTLTVKKLICSVAFALAGANMAAQAAMLGAQQPQRVIAKLDATHLHQRITGFGGFVCSPQFQYNHMSTTDIKKV